MHNIVASGYTNNFCATAWVEFNTPSFETRPSDMIYVIAEKENEKEGALKYTVERTTPWEEYEDHYTITTKTKVLLVVNKKTAAVSFRPSYCYPTGCHVLAHIQCEVITKLDGIYLCKASFEVVAPTSNDPEDGTITISVEENSRLDDSDFEDPGEDDDDATLSDTD